MASTALADAARSAAVQRPSADEDRDPRAIALIKGQAQAIAAALPAMITPERFARAAMTAVRIIPELNDCTRESFLGALLECAQLGLEPGPLGLASILPFNNRRKENGEWVTKKEAQLIIEYRGYVDLFYRSNQLKSINLGVVHQGDVWKSYTDETGKHLYHEELEEDTPVIAYYGVFLLNTGGSVIQTLTPNQVESYRKRAQSQRIFDKTTNKYIASPDPIGAWESDYDSMALKTIVRRAENKLPKSTELVRAFAVDEKPVFNFGGPSAKAVDNIIDVAPISDDIEVSAPVAPPATGTGAPVAAEVRPAATGDATPKQTKQVAWLRPTPEQLNTLMETMAANGIAPASTNSYVASVIGRQVRGVTTLSVDEMNLIFDAMEAATAPKESPASESAEPQSMNPEWQDGGHD